MNRHHLKLMKSSMYCHLKGLAAVSLGAIAAASLSPQPAEAQGYSFGFDGVAGTIRNLFDNTSGQKGSVEVEVMSNPIDSMLNGIYTYTGGDGITTDATGAITSINWFGTKGDVDVYNLALTDSPRLLGSLTADGQSAASGDLTLTRVPASLPVPAPLPLFGAAAAFGCSRKLRNRIKSTKGYVSNV